jgi:hypothetical protein
MAPLEAVEGSVQWKHLSRDKTVALKDDLNNVLFHEVETRILSSQKSYSFGTRVNLLTPQRRGTAGREEYVHVTVRSFP